MNSSLFHSHRGYEEISNIGDTIYLFHELKIEKHKIFPVFLRKQNVLTSHITMSQCRWVPVFECCCLSDSRGFVAY